MIAASCLNGVAISYAGLRVQQLVTATTFMVSTQAFMGGREGEEVGVHLLRVGVEREVAILYFGLRVQELVTVTTFIVCTHALGEGARGK
jgi:hypothetical protein